MCLHTSCRSMAKLFFTSSWSSSRLLSSLPPFCAFPSFMSARDLSQLLKIHFLCKYSRYSHYYCIFFFSCVLLRRVININFNALHIFLPPHNLHSSSASLHYFMHLCMITYDTEMSMQKEPATREWWKCNWNINRIFHTSRDLPKAIGLFAFITIIQLQ